jgi:hypothetical protein
MVRRAEGGLTTNDVNTGYRHPEVRSAGETELYFGAAGAGFRATWLPARGSTPWT